MLNSNSMSGLALKPEAEVLRTHHQVLHEPWRSGGGFLRGSGTTLLLQGGSAVGDYW
jgi:hypothetical protein